MQRRWLSSLIAEKEGNTISATYTIGKPTRNMLCASFLSHEDVYIRSNEEYASLNSFNSIRRVVRLSLGRSVDRSVTLKLQVRKRAPANPFRNDIEIPRYLLTLT